MHVQLITHWTCLGYFNDLGAGWGELDHSHPLHPRRQHEVGAHVCPFSCLVLKLRS